MEAGPGVAVASAEEDHPVTGRPITESRWIKKYVNAEEIQKIGELVQEVEKKTKAEIVPMIVLRSSTVGHVPLMLTLILLLIFLPLEFHFLNWASTFEFNLWLSSAAIVAFVFSLWLSRSLVMQRWMTPNADEAFHVWQRAELEFHRQKMNQTQSRAGILLFVSIMERKAVLLTDEAVHKLLPNEIWSPLLKEFSTLLRQGKWMEGFSKALQRCGELLTEKFPSEGEAPRNELANSLRIKE